MHDGCLIEVKTIGELSLGWPKGGSFYVVFVAGDLFWQFSDGCVLVGSTALCFLLLNLTSEENIFCGKNWVGIFFKRGHLFVDHKNM